MISIRKNFNFDIISSTKDSTGNKMEIDEATDLAITSIKLSEAFTNMAPNLENISEMSESSKLIALEKTQKEIETIGKILSKLDYNSKVVLQDMMPGIKETITFNYGESCNEQILNGRTGIIVPQGNETLFIESLEKLIVNSKKLENMGKACKKYNEIFSIDKVIKNWDELFKSM